jgi:hypothetical protein
MVALPPRTTRHFFPLPAYKTNHCCLQDGMVQAQCNEYVRITLNQIPNRTPTPYLRPRYIILRSPLTIITTKSSQASPRAHRRKQSVAPAFSNISQIMPPTTRSQMSSTLPSREELVQQQQQQQRAQQQITERQERVDRLQLSQAAGANSGPQDPESGFGVQDYQLQLMVLEQQNAERLFKVRAEKLRQLEMALRRKESASQRETVECRISGF